jgi:hypothetical protein
MERRCVPLIIEPLGSVICRLRIRDEQGVCIISGRSATTVSTPEDADVAHWAQRSEARGVSGEPANSIGATGDWVERVRLSHSRGSGCPVRGVSGAAETRMTTCDDEMSFDEPLANRSKARVKKSSMSLVAANVHCRSRIWKTGFLARISCP